MILTNWPRLILFLSFILVLTVLSIPNDSKMGVIYFKSFEYEKALTFFDKAKSTNSESPLILKKIKDYFIIQGDIQKALISQRKLTQLLPKNIGHWEELVKLYNWNNMPYNALKAQVQIASLNPTQKKFEILLNIQKGYQWLRKWDDASKIGEVIYTSNNPKILEENLKYYLTVADTKSVIKHIQKLEKLTNNTTKYQFYLAQAYTLSNNFPEAIKSLLISFGNNKEYAKHYQTANFLNHPLPYILKRSETLEQIIDLYEKLNDDLSVARIHTKLYEIDPRKYDLALDAADIYVKYEMYDETYAILKKIYNVRSASRVYRAAHIYLDLGDQLTAIKYLEQTILLYPYKAEYFNDLTNLYEKTNQKRKALGLQIRLLKYLKNKNSNSNFYINSTEVLYSQNGIIKHSDSNTNEIKNTHNRIIQLMEELGETDQKHEQLKVLNKEFPNDINAMKMLAFSHVENGEKDKAKSLFSKINTINPYDEDAAIYIADGMLQVNNVDMAYKTLKPFIDNTKIKFKNRFFNIYQKKDPNAVKKICKEHKITDTKDFTQIDLKVKCNAIDNNYRDSINILLAHLDQVPDNKYAKVLLSYQFLHDKDLQSAKRLITDLKKENTPKKTITDLEKYKNEVILDLKIQKSWEHSLNYSYYDSSDHFFWTNTFELYRNVGDLSYGVKILRAEPSKTNTTIGNNSFLIKYHFKDELVATLYFGNNFGHSDKVAYGYSVLYQWLDRILVSYTADIATQIYDIPAFSSATEALRDNHNVFFNYDYDYRNRFALSLNYNHIYVENNYAKSRSTALQYNYFLTNHWSPGFFLQKQETYDGNDSLRNLLIDSSSVQALNLKHEYIFYNNKLKNTVDFYIGRDSDRNIEFGEYISLRESLYYEHSKRKHANFQLEWNKESQNINENESIRVQIGYSFWFL